MKSLLPCLLVALLLGCAGPEKQPLAQGHQAPDVAYAYPVTGITVDGDPADWPGNGATYPITALLAHTIDSPADFAAHFRVGYAADSNAVYALVTVTDDVPMASAAAGSLTDEQDQCLMFLDRMHNASGSGVNVYCFNALYQAIDGAANSWDPAARQPNWAGVAVATQRIGNQTHYEIKISYAAGIAPGQALGLDFMVYDADSLNGTDALTRVAWTPSEGKEKAPFRLGYVVLAEGSTELGTIEGSITWQEEPLGPVPNKIRIASTQQPSLWVRAHVDSTGHYTATLPAGT